VSKGKSPMILSDRRARRIAATEFGKNLVIEAGAGTGKTSLLVERLLNIVGSGLLDITQIAAITFTEKAAGEMRHRVAVGLERLRALARAEKEADDGDESGRAYKYLIGEADVSPEEIASRTLAALEVLDRATIVTIHSFCSEMLRSHPFEAGVDPDFSVDSGEKEATSCAEAWEEFIARELGPQAPRPKLWRGLLDHFSISDAGKVARELCRFSFPDSVLTPPHDCAATAEMRTSLAGELLREIDDLLKHAGGMTSKTTAYFETMRAAVRTLHDDGLEQYSRFINSDSELLRRIEKRNPPKPNKKLTGVSGKTLKDLSAKLLRLARNLSRANDPLINALLEAVAPFALEFRESFLRQGFVSFDGLLSLARDLLRDHRQVREELKSRYRMLLVDEFQDTDPLQYEIVLFLAERPQGGAINPFETDLDPGRLFIVGDPKQSIYRFRSADYSAYHSAVERIRGKDGELHDLVTNFRSVPGIVEPVNQLFAAGGSSVWSASAHQPDYKEIESARKQLRDAPSVDMWTLQLEEDRSAAARRVAEGRLIAEEIKRLVDAGEASFGEVAVLLRTFTNVSLYLRPLREMGIPFVVDGGREFLKRPEIAQLLATLQVLTQPADEAALLAFLRSPCGGLSDDELAAYAAAGGRWDWRTIVDASRFERIGERFGLLQSLSRETRHLPAETVVRRVVERTDMLPLGAAAFEGAQRVANMQKLAAVAGDLARDGTLSLEEIVEALREERVANTQADSPLADDLADAVHISSIHSMKGLESRLVFIPDLARGRGGGQSETVQVGAARLPGGRTIPAIRAGDIHSSAWAWKVEDDERHERAEETRVLYVAATRAKERLILLGGTDSDSSHWIDATSAWGYSPEAPPQDGAKIAGGLVLHRHLRPPTSTTNSTISSPRGAEQAVRAYDSAVAALLKAASPPFAAPSGLHAEPEGEAPPVPSGSSGDLGLVVGSLIHGLMERWDGVSGESAREILHSMSEPAAEESRIAEKILDAFLASPLAARYREIEIVERELRMLLRSDDGTLYRGSIDLLYRCAAGDLVVADYKTDAEEDDEKLRERYGGQLRVYAEAVRQACRLPSPPRAELWMLRSGRCIEIV